MFQFNFDPKPAAAATEAEQQQPREEFKGRVGWLQLPTSSSNDDSCQFNQLQLERGITVWAKNGHAPSKSHSVAKDTEVVPMVYEGGFKIWECSYDIISSLAAAAAASDEPLRILDLGCGAGIVGIWCLLHFPHSQVVFHDLNDSVLEQVTMPNVLRNLNADDSATKNRTQFFCGPWHLTPRHELGKFDLIVSGDTMYSMDALPDLVDILCDALKGEEKNSSRAVLAAKRYYFGVGGGSSSFMDLVGKRANAGRCRVVHSVTDGSSNIRDVVEFTL